MISSLVINCPEFNESLLFPQISFSGYICYIIYCDYTWLLKLLTERFSHPLEWLPHSDICELVTVGKCWSRSNSLERSDNYASDVCTSYSDGSKSAPGGRLGSRANPSLFLSYITKFKWIWCDFPCFLLPHCLLTMWMSGIIYVIHNNHVILLYMPISRYMMY